MGAQDRPKIPQDRPKIAPRRPKIAPRSPQDAPGASQERPRAARSGPRAVPERPRAAKRALGTILGPSCGISEPCWGQKCMVFLWKIRGEPVHAKLRVFLQWPLLDEHSNEFWLSKMLCFAMENLWFFMRTIVNEQRLGFKLYMKLGLKVRGSGSNS